MWQRGENGGSGPRCGGHGCQGREGGTAEGWIHSRRDWIACVLRKFTLRMEAEEKTYKCLEAEREVKKLSWCSMQDLIVA